MVELNHEQCRRARRELHAQLEVAREEAGRARRELQAILSALPVGVWITDAAGSMLEANPAAVRIWGGQAPHFERPSGSLEYKAFWPATGARVAPEEWALARTFKTGETIVAEAIDIERFDGTRGHVLNSTAPILDERGQLVGGVVVILDVTEARAAELERVRLIGSLEFERSRFGTLLQQAPAFIAVVRGPDHVFELVNDAYYQLVGQRALIGKRCADAIPGIAEQGFVAMLDGVLATGTPFVGRGVPILLAGRPGAATEQHRYVDFVCQPLAEVDGTRTGIFMHGIDVTDATIAKRRLRAQFHAVPAPTYVWQRAERDGQSHLVLVDFNAAAIAISDGTIASHLGEPAERYYAEAPLLLAELLHSASTGETTQRELGITRSTGEQRRLCVTCASSAPDLVVVHTEDITERRRVEAELRQAHKMEAVGRLAAGVAHDFNNILSVILSYSELQLDELAAGDPCRDYVVEIHKAGLRAVALTRQLLAFSRRQLLAPRLLDLDQILAGVSNMLRHVLGEAIELSILTGPELRAVWADPGQIEQVIMNLVVNARDAMPAGGRLTIETSNIDLDGTFTADHAGVAPGPYVLLALTDTGTGMDEATRAQIFEPFFTTKGQQGTGLGLSTVFGIVHQSGGTIWVSSELGHGTTFRIYLPRAPDAAATLPIQIIAAPSVGGTETILVVEDDDALRMVVCTVLRRGGYQVLDAQNGGEAFLIAEQFPAAIHLLLTDVMMPRMSGRQLAERLGLLRTTMKIMYMSGYGDDAILQRGILESGSAFLQKPITSEALLRKVRSVLD